MLVVTLLFKGRELDPSIITERLGVYPSRSHRNSEMRTSGFSKGLVAKTGVWALQTDGEVKTSSLSDHLQFIKKAIGKNIQHCSTLPNVEESFLDILLTADSDESGEVQAELRIEPEDLAIMSSLNIATLFTFRAGPK